jgi:hypothetical protein
MSLLSSNGKERKRLRFKRIGIIGEVIVVNYSRSLRVFIGILAASSLAVLIFGAAFIYSSSEYAAEATPVAEVNGDVITAVEFNRVLGLQRASVIDYFKRTYDVKFSKDFWYTDYNGEVPADTLRKQALEEVVKIKIQLNLAKSYGIVQGTSYNDLLAEMEKENAQRSAAVRSGQPVYGPIKFDENRFADFYMSRVLIELKERLSEDKLAVTDEQLMKHYGTIKDELFRLEDNVRFNKISVSYLEAGQRADNDKKQHAKETMESVKRLLEQDKTVDEAVNQLQSADDTFEIQVTEEHFDNETARIYFKSQPELYLMLAEHTQAGQVSPVIDDRAAGQYVVARIVEREPNGYKSFEEQKSNVFKHYMDALFDAYLNKLINEAKVNLVEDNYYKIMVE